MRVFPNYHQHLIADDGVNLTDQRYITCSYRQIIYMVGFFPPEATLAQAPIISFSKQSSYFALIIALIIILF